MDQIKAIMDRVDALSIRERGIILAAIIFIMFTVWNKLLMQPQLLEERKVLADLQLKQAEQTVMNIRFQEQVRKDQTDPDAVNRARLETLKKQLAEIETDVRESTNHLVSPNNMAVILQTILNKSRGLQLTEIRGLGVSPLIAVAAVPAGQEGVASPPAVDALENAYKHGLILKFEGDYMSTLQYLRELEALEWGFFWENLEYEVIEYPRGRVSITLYTLSLERDWIGV
jgi:MSHA biogenesis protein MshJ